MDLKTIFLYYFIKIPIVNNYYFNESLINKKEKLKFELYKFVKFLYISMTFKIIPDDYKKLNDKYIKNMIGTDKHDLPIQGITEKELHKFHMKLYKIYIGIINNSLCFNKEEISKDYMNYFLRIQLDMLDACSKSENTFIRFNDLKHIQKLKNILKEIYSYSSKNDYFTPYEWYDFLSSYRENFYIDNKDILKNLNKIPKHLKRKKKCLQITKPIAKQIPQLIKE